MLFVDVDPFTANTLTPCFISSTLLILLPFFTSNDCPALKYTSEKSTSFLRSSVIVIVAIIASISPFFSIGMRVLDVTSFSSSFFSSPRIFFASALATSTSNPSTCPVEGFFNPNKFVSFFTPTTNFPRFLICSTAPPCFVFVSFASSFLLPHPATTSTNKHENTIKVNNFFILSMKFLL